MSLGSTILVSFLAMTYTSCVVFTGMAIQHYVDREEIAACHTQAAELPPKKWPKIRQCGGQCGEVNWMD